MKENRFKDTEIGRIPVDWQVNYIGNLTKVSSGGTPRTSEPSYWGGDIPWMNSGELNRKIVNSVIGRITEKGLSSSSTRWIPAGCVLIGLAGQGKTRGTAAFNTIPLCINQSIGAIFPSDCFNNKYLYYYMNTLYCYLRQLSDGGGGRGGLTKALLQGIIVPIPSKEEQSQIASALTSIDNLISSLDKLIEKKKNIKQGTMQQLLTGKKRLKGFSEPWVEKQLGDCANVLYGFLFTPDYYTKTGKYKVATIGNVQEGKFYPDGCNNVNISSSFLNDYQYLKPGDLLISMTGNVGRVCIINAENYVMNYRVGKIVVNSDLCLQLLFHLLNQKGFIEDMLNKAKGAAQLNISKDDILSYSFLCPKSISEQSAIATVLSSMDEEISSLEAKRDKYASIKQGMMQQLLTGKIRLID